MTVLEVRRSGGLLGHTRAAFLNLAGRDERAREARELVAGVDPDAAPQGRPHPDMFTYTFRLPGVPEFSVPEHLLTPPLQRLVELALED